MSNEFSKEYSVLNSFSSQNSVQETITYPELLMTLLAIVSNAFEEYSVLKSVNERVPNKCFG